MRLRVLIIDADGRQALPFMRAIRRAGHHVTAACYSRLSPGYLSRYPSRRLLVPNHQMDREGLLRALERELRSGRHDVMLPFGHDTMIMCVQNKRRWERCVSLPVAEPELFEYAIDKGKTMAFCMDNDIPCPVTYFPDEEDLESITARAAFPLWLKPRVGIGAIGGRRLDSPEQARQYHPSLRQKYGPMILQEYIPHEGSMQLVFHTFMDANGKMCTGMLSLKPRYFPLRGGTSTCLISVDQPEVAAYCKRLFEGIGLTGIADADIIVDPRDGQAKVMEINPRVSCSIKIGFASGIDYADMWLRLATGRPIARRCGYRRGLILRNLCQEILWYLFSDRAARKATHPPFFNFFGSNVFYQTIAADDPLTFVGFVLNMLAKYSDPAVRAAKMGRE